MVLSNDIYVQYLVIQMKLVHVNVQLISMSCTFTCTSFYHYMSCTKIMVQLISILLLLLIICFQGYKGRAYVAAQGLS